MIYFRIMLTAATNSELIASLYCSKLRKGCPNLGHVILLIFVVDILLQYRTVRKSEIISKNIENKVSPFNSLKGGAGGETGGSE